MHPYPEEKYSLPNLSLSIRSNRTRADDIHYYGCMIFERQRPTLLEITPRKLNIKHYNGNNGTKKKSS